MHGVTMKIKKNNTTFKKLIGRTFFDKNWDLIIVDI